MTRFDGAGPVRVHTGPAPHVVRVEITSDPDDGATTVSELADGLREALAWAFGAGYRRVELFTQADDVESRTAATLCGLRREGVLRGAGADGEDVVVLARLVDDVDPDVDRLPTIASWFHLRTIASGVVVRSDDGRVLLLQPSYKPEWEIPGGMVEAGEDVVGTARRECLEELGFELPVGALLAVAYTPVNSRRPDAMAFLFDGGVHPLDLVERASFADGEILSARWCGRSEIAERASGPLARRLLTILDAFDSRALPGPALFIEGADGLVVPDEPA